MIFSERFTNDDEVAAAVDAKLALKNELEAGIINLSQHPQATEDLLYWLCEVYGDLEMLAKIKFPPEPTADNATEIKAD